MFSDGPSPQLPGVGRPGVLSRDSWCGCAPVDASAKRSPAARFVRAEIRVVSANREHAVREEKSRSAAVDVSRSRDSCQPAGTDSANCKDPHHSVRQIEASVPDKNGCQTAVPGAFFLNTLFSAACRGSLVFSRTELSVRRLA